MKKVTWATPLRKEANEMLERTQGSGRVKEIEIIFRGSDGEPDPHASITCIPTSQDGDGVMHLTEFGKQREEARLKAQEQATANADRQVEDDVAFDNALAALLATSAGGKSE